MKQKQFVINWEQHLPLPAESVDPRADIQCII